MDKIEHPLKKAALKVLEDWALMLVDEVPESQPDLFDREATSFMSWVEIHGTFNGAVSIIAQEPFMRALANNVLGVTDGVVPSEEDRKDAFKEMGNVLAGNFLTEAYGEDITFDLFNPSVQEVPFTDVERFMIRNLVFTFMADDVPVAITFSIKK